MASSPQAGSVAEVVGRNTKQRGLAIIVANGYKDVADFSTLDGTHKDGTRMQDVFNTLGIANMWKKNVTGNEMTKLLNEIAQLDTLPQSYHSISFVFAGHGKDNEELSLQDGVKMKVNDIVRALCPGQAPEIGVTPKLFFIDACRGPKKIKPVSVPTSGSGDVRPRGATNVPEDGNYLVAYSCIPNHMAYESKEGGVWMMALAKALSRSKENIEAVLTEVREELNRDYQSFGPMQLSESVSRLLQKVYLNPERHPPPAHADQPANSFPTGATVSQPIPLPSAPTRGSPPSQLPAPTRNFTPPIAAASTCRPKDPKTRLKELCDKDPNMSQPVYDTHTVMDMFQVTVKLSLNRRGEEDHKKRR